MVRSICLLLALCSTGLAQIEMSYRPTKVVANVVAPRIVGDRIVMEVESAPTILNGALIKIVTSEKVRVKARRSLFETSDLIFDERGEYLLTGDGEYLVEANSANHERSMRVVVGDGSSPSPPPKPDPPLPPTPPTPDVVIDDTYHVGMIAFDKAPKDATGAKVIAAFYRTGANKLFGTDGVLSDIQSILNEIGRQLDNKTCPDRVTCEKWKEWRLTLNAAVIAEQNKRGTLSHKQWYELLVEIAKALEVVK